MNFVEIGEEGIVNNKQIQNTIMLEVVVFMDLNYSISKVVNYRVDETIKVVIKNDLDLNVN